MANSYEFNNIATILNQIVADAQGRTADITATPRDTSQFVTMAQVALSMGTDPIMKSISQLINRSLFVARPYKANLDILQWDNVTFGNAVRKLTPVGVDEAQDNLEYDDAPADGTSADQWKVKRPKVLQMQYVGAEKWDVQEPTVFEHQLNSAFRSPEELAQFLSMIRMHVMNEMEQEKEQLARMTLSSFIASKVKSDTDNVIHLLTEYNAATGLKLDAQSVYQPTNFEAFIRWTAARMREISGLMEERSVKYHQGITGYTILRHTPKEYQRCIMYSKATAMIDTMVRESFFDNWLKFPQYSTVNFWQNINDPQKIVMTPPILSATGNVSKSATTVTQDNVFAVLYDRDAIGYNIINDGMNQTPINAKSRYYNTFHHMIKRYCIDVTENGVVFLLD